MQLETDFDAEALQLSCRRDFWASYEQEREAKLAVTDKGLSREHEKTWQSCSHKWLIGSIKW